MTWLTGTLTAVLALSFSALGVDGQNACLLDPACDAGQTNLVFIGCGFVDADMPDLKDCFNAIGRSDITTIFLLGTPETIPGDLFEGMGGLLSLTMPRTDIVSIGVGAFQDLSSLTKLNLNGNKLESIPPNMFTGLGSLQELNLSDNSLVSLTVESFVGVPSLERLELAGNSLASLPAEGFVGLPSLRLLDLASNSLASLPVAAFAGLPSLQLLHLDDNALTTLPAGIFEDLGSGDILRVLYLDGNPELQCIPTVTASGEWYDDSSEPTYAPDLPDTAGLCECAPAAAVMCENGLACAPGGDGYTCVDENGDVTGDPHMSGLRGQHTEWSGVDGGWYSLIKDDDSQLHINVRLTAPLAAEFPDRQLVTGLAVLSDGHSLVIEVKNPYSVATTGCLDGSTPCLADGALRVTSDGSEDTNLLHPMDSTIIHFGAMVVSAANLPTECTKFGGDKIWAEAFDDMQAAHRRLEEVESFEDWVANSTTLAAPEWCAKYLSERGLAQVQSKFATFRIQTSSVTVRLNVGVNYQGGGETDWDGRLLPDIEFWQMDVGLANMNIGDALTGILGETSRPVLDEDGVEIMEGPRVIRGAVEDYRLSGPLDDSFILPPPQNIGE